MGRERRYEGGWKKWEELKMTKNTNETTNKGKAGASSTAADTHRPVAGAH